MKQQVSKEIFQERQVSRKTRTILCLFLFISTAVFLWPGLGFAIQHDRGYGEPYALLGKRIVFTTWYFVYPGEYDWRDASGNRVYAQETYKLKEGEAFYIREDCPVGISFCVEKPEREIPAIPKEKPWEAMGIAPVTLLEEEGIYRLWTNCQAEDGTSYCGYFESNDGKVWQRPDLGLVEFQGSTNNNLYTGPTGVVFIDPKSPPSERYKTAFHTKFDPEQFNQNYKTRRPFSLMALEADPGRVHSICAAVSPDGLRWTALPDPISVEHSDTHIVIYYDQTLEKYVMYTRSQMVGPRAEGFSIDMRDRRHSFTVRRAIGRAESADFKEFPLSETIIEPGTDMKPTDSYYTNCRTTIPRAPDHHLMFPAVYHLLDDTTSIELHTSYDGRLWHRAPGGYLLDVSNEGQPDSGCIFAVPNLVELPNGDWILPYTGYRYPHKFPRGAWSFDVGFMRWPKGRMIALHAPEKGEFATVAFVSPGEKLLINAVTKLTGYVLVEVCDFHGKPLPKNSFEKAIPIVGDHYRSPVQWEDTSALSVKKGDPIILRFRMEKAKIYGLDFE